jgi:hypothetical protein
VIVSNVDRGWRARDARDDLCGRGDASVASTVDTRDGPAARETTPRETTRARRMETNAGDKNSDNACDL